MRTPGGRPIITLLTDFGEGSYVASVKGVLLAHAPEASLVDITHGVPAGAIGSAGYLIRETAAYFPKGTVHLCVVDPGVGTDRLPLIVCADGSCFVGPDNGLFHEVIRRADGDAMAYRIEEGPWLPEPRCPTFHGRDLFAPVAGLLALGESVATMGSPLEADSLVPSPIPPPERKANLFSGQVVWVDGFGNLITNLPESDVTAWSDGAPFRALVGDVRIERRIGTFRDGESGTVALLFGSWSTLEIVVSEGSAAGRLGVKAGEPVYLERIDGS